MKQIEIEFLNEGELSMNAAVGIPISNLNLKHKEPDRRKKILLVDEDSAIRQILLRLLSEEGYFVVTAANETEALEFASVMTFDLVLLDLSTPARDGWEVFEQLYAENPLLAIILISSKPNQFYSARSPSVGALLEKPLDFTKLFFAIHSLLENQTNASAAHSTVHAHAALACNISPKP